MANKYDLKTWNAVGLASAAAGAKGTNIGGAAVAAGKNRFLTYIRVTRAELAECSICTAAGLQVGSVTTGAASTPSVVSGRKVKVGMPYRTGVSNLRLVDADVLQEIRGTIEQPILSVAGSGWMGLFVSGATVDVHAQYFDE